ncbi:MAG: HDOD domain-containing protein [Gammaproteobacteria bacterium]|nr:HDOD domain-containing protein [Gammaproteobacteria bacterium]
MSSNPGEILIEITEMLKSGEQMLPGLPDIALRVRKAIAKENADIMVISKIIQSDIPLTARLIQIANSPMYRGVKPVDDCHKAITRLGLDVTKNLVTSFALRRAFTARSAPTRKRVEQLWKHSVQVASIAFILARITPKLHPDHAMLAALIHDVGVLPLLGYLERRADLLKDPEAIFRMERELRVALGKLVLSNWRFDTEFVDVIEAAEDWYRDPVETPDYGDVVLVSQIHAAFGKPEAEELPSLEELPAMGKFPVFKLGPGASMELLAEAKDEMKELQHLLAN